MSSLFYGKYHFYEEMFILIGGDGIIKMLLPYSGKDNEAGKALVKGLKQIV